MVPYDSAGITVEGQDTNGISENGKILSGNGRDREAKKLQFSLPVEIGHTMSGKNCFRIQLR